MVSVPSPTNPQAAVSAVPFSGESQVMSSLPTSNTSNFQYGSSALISSAAFVKLKLPVTTTWPSIRTSSRRRTQIRAVWQMRAMTVVKQFGLPAHYANCKYWVSREERGQDSIIDTRPLGRCRKEIGK